MTTMPPSSVIASKGDGFHSHTHTEAWSHRQWARLMSVLVTSNKEHVPHILQQKANIQYRASSSERCSHVLFHRRFVNPSARREIFFLTAAWRCKFFRYNLPETFHRPEVAMVFSPLFLNYFLYSTISNNSTLCCIIPPSYSNLILI